MPNPIISKPANNGYAKVVGCNPMGGVKGEICAAGSGITDSAGHLATKIYALISQGGGDPGMQPPPGTPSIVPTSDNWQFSRVAGASCNVANRLYVWFEFVNPADNTRRDVNFMGQLAGDGKTDCGT